MYQQAKRFFRLSVSSWLIIFSILCLVVFVYTRFIRTRVVEARAIQELRDLGVNVGVSYKPGPGPEWAKVIFGENVFARVNSVNLGGNLKTLDGCRDQIAQLEHLKHLVLSSSVLENVDALSDFRGLDTIEFIDTSSLEDIDALSKLRFSRVVFVNCNGITSLDSLKLISSLKEIDIGACDGIKELDFRGWKLANLKEVTAVECDGLVAVNGFRQVSENCLLNLERCNALEEITIHSNSNLDFITIVDCPTLDSISVLPQTLKGLGIDKCDSLRKVEGPELTRINSLVLKSCNQLASLDVSLSSVEHFKLVACSGIRNLDFSQPLPRLASVHVWFCDGIVAIDGLPESVEELKLLKCQSLKRVTPSASLSNLKILTLRRCPNLLEAPKVLMRALADESLSQ